MKNRIDKDSSTVWEQRQELERRFQELENAERDELTPIDLEP
jgi:hypothetical protein